MPVPEEPTTADRPDGADLLVRDARGGLLPVDEARRAVRALGVDDDGVRAANRAGAVHPAQDGLVRAPGAGVEVLVFVLGVCIGATTLLMAVVGGLAGQPTLASRSAVATVAVLVPTIVTFVVSRRRRIARRRASPVVTVRDRIRRDPRPEGYEVAPLLGDRRLGLDHRFAGLPVVAHVIDGPVPVVLSADLDEDALVTVSRAEVDAAARALPVQPPVVLRGRGAGGATGFAAGCAAVLVVSIVGGATASTVGGRATGLVVGVLAGFFLLLTLATLPGARREARTRYEVVDGVDGVTVTVHRPGRPAEVVTSTEVTALGHDTHAGNAGTWWLTGPAGQLTMRGPTGEQVVRAVRRRRPDLAVEVVATGN